MAKAHHPDSNNGAVSSSSAEQFHRVQAAYELLSDPTRKADFDRYGRADDSSGSGGGREEDEAEGSDDLGSEYATFTGGRRRRQGREWQWAGGSGGGVGFDDASDFMHDMFGTWKGFGVRQLASAHRQ